MRKIRWFVVSGALALFGFAGTAAAVPLQVGVSDDYGKFHVCSSPFWPAFLDIGYHVNRMTVLWDEANPGAIPDKAFLDQAIPCAVAKGARVVLAIYPLHATAIGNNLAAAAAFAQYAAQVVNTYPQVQDFIIGNEANQDRFWQPQFRNGAGASGPDYEAMLAMAYDAIHRTRNVNVIGLAISSRGNDNPAANQSTSPVHFIHDFAAAYRASGRTTPIMDELAFHPYQNVNSDPFTKPLQWPNAGAANLDRIKQAIWDGFNGTGQSVFAEQAGGKPTKFYGGFGLRLLLAEGGAQTKVAGHSGYTGTENVPVVDEPTQSQFHQGLMDIAECDPSVEALLYFLMIDEPDLNRFQSGNIFADMAHKDSYNALKMKIAHDQGNCQSTPAGWVHTTQVVGASATFKTANARTNETFWTLTGHADEDATYKAGIFSLRAAPDKNAAARGLASVRLVPAVLSTQGQIDAYRNPLIRFPAKTLKPGVYYYAIFMHAAMNPSRTSFFTSANFQVGGRR